MLAALWLLQDLKLPHLADKGTAGVALNRLCQKCIWCFFCNQYLLNGEEIL